MPLLKKKLFFEEKIPCCCDNNYHHEQHHLFMHAHSLLVFASAHRANVRHVHTSSSLKSSARLNPIRILPSISITGTPRCPDFSTISIARSWSLETSTSSKGIFRSFSSAFACLQYGQVGVEYTVIFFILFTSNNNRFAASLLVIYFASSKVYFEDKPGCFGRALLFFSKYPFSKRCPISESLT